MNLQDFRRQGAKLLRAQGVRRPRVVLRVYLDMYARMLLRDVGELPSMPIFRNLVGCLKGVDLWGVEPETEAWLRRVVDPLLELERLWTKNSHVMRGPDHVGNSRGVGIVIRPGAGA